VQLAVAAAAATATGPGVPCLFLGSRGRVAGGADCTEAGQGGNTSTLLLADPTGYGYFCAFERAWAQGGGLLHLHGAHDIQASPFEMTPARSGTMFMAREPCAINGCPHGCTYTKTQSN
jgi:hypothetical protein